MLARLGALVRDHRALAGVLAAAALLRVAVGIEYRPALLYTDSFFYLDLASRGDPVGIAPEHPSGYPLFLDLLWSPGRSLAPVAVVQHLAGLATGVLLYALLVRLGVRRGIAAAAAAVVLLDAYAVVLEQHVLTEALFCLALVASLVLAADAHRAWPALAASGALLGLAATLRAGALFAVPAWLAYVLLRRRSVPLAAAAALGLAAPLLAYAIWHDAHTGRFGITQADGWYLYTRIAEIGDCREADVPDEGRALCGRTPRDDREGVYYHLVDSRSPAVRAFGRMSPDPERQARSNQVLRDFALAIVRDRPLEYARLVGADFGRYFLPGVAPRYEAGDAIALPRTSPHDANGRGFGGRDLPDSGGPASVLRAYAGVFHTPRWLIGALLVVALAGAAAGLRRRLEDRRSAETLLLAGAALSLLLGSVAVSDFDLRYLLPTVPPIVGAGVLGATDLARLRSSASWLAEPGTREPSLARKQGARSARHAGDR
jgi:hypothetical protein